MDSRYTKCAIAALSSNEVSVDQLTIEYTIPDGGVAKPVRTGLHVRIT